MQTKVKKIIKLRSKVSQRLRMKWMIIFISEIYVDEDEDEDEDEDVESPASYYVRCMYKEKTKLQAAVCMYNVQNM